MEGPLGRKSDDDQLRVQLLGDFAVWVGQKKVAEEQWHLRRTRSLIKLLALAPSHRMHRDQVIDTLWPESDLTAAANNFHQTLYATRQVLDAAGAGTGCLRLEEGFLSLCSADGQGPWVDVEQFEAAAAAVKEGRDPARYQEALDLYQGDLLPDDLYSAWAIQRREILRQEYESLLMGLARLLESRQEYPRAVEILVRLLSGDPGNEEAHAALMRQYALSGQRHQALRQYQVLREALRAELDVEPSDSTVQLYAAVQSGAYPPNPISTQADLPPSVASGTAAPERHHNLPVQLTSFIGRETQIAEVARLVKERHLVTLTGSGGVGKTRLAIKVAETLLEEFPQGVWMVELASLSTPSLVVREIAERLKIIEQPGQNIGQVLENYLRARSLLLVLDNCEHVIAGAAALAANLLRSCPKLRILATSREILGVEGEIAFRCPSLSLPAEQHQVINVSELAKSEAVRLFVDRARFTRVEFTLNESNAVQVAQICRQLDGIPLAIELAVARMRMLSVEQIASRLGHTFSLLKSGNRTELARHQTLKALIDWSYNLLSSEEASLLRRLSIFAGGWDLEAAESVCTDPEDSAGPIRLQAAHILDLLGGLIDKSLIQFEEIPGAEPRYCMLETVRQYALERLAEHGRENVRRDRHLEYYLSLCLRAEPHLRARQANYWLDRLNMELDNLRLALEWTLNSEEQSRPGMLEKGLRLATSMLWYWWIRSHSIEGKEWLERLLQAQGDQHDIQNMDAASKAARGRALYVLSLIIWQNIAVGTLSPVLKPFKNSLDQESQSIFLELGDAYRRDYAISRYIQAETAEDLLGCRDLFRKINDPFWLGQCAMSLVLLHPPTSEKAYFFAEEHLAVSKEIGDLDGEGAAAALLGYLELCRGNIDQSIQRKLESVACLEMVGNWRFAAYQRSQLAFVYIMVGNYQEAIRQSQMARAVGLELNNLSLLHFDLNLQAYIAWANREYEQAVRHCEEALVLHKDLPDEYKLLSLYLLGRTALSQDKLSLAEEYLKRVLKTAPFTDEWMYFQTIQSMGVLAVRQGQMRKAAAWFGVRDEFFEQHDWVYYSPPERSDYETALAAARAALGEAEFPAAWEMGRAMSVDQVIQYAQAG